MKDVELKNHKLFLGAKQSFSEDYYLLCNKVSNFHAIKLDTFSGIEKMYRFCPVCGENIQQLVKKYFLQKEDNQKK